MGKFAAAAKTRKIQDLGWGLSVRIGDLTLLSLFLGLTLALPSRHTGKFLSELLGKLHLTENEGRIRNTVYQLKRQGLIDYSQRFWQAPRITEQGKERLARILPHYDEARIWDKHLYLVTYDIPNPKKFTRDKLRQTLKVLGCGLLQESVWLTPYNPKTILEKFVVYHDLIGLVLISDLGKNGSVGEEDTRGLMSRVYKLDGLNQRYQEFLDLWLKPKPQPETLTHFYSILKDDPQLPFVLLPDNWLGEKAWELIFPLVKSVIKTRSSGA